MLHEEALRKIWDGRARFDELLHHACELRLLRITTRRLDEATDARLVSLGHDALAKVAQPWKDELEKRAERRKWRLRGAVAAAAVALFAALSLAALSASDRAKLAQQDAVFSADRALKALEEAKLERNRAVQAEENARANEDKAKKSEETARAKAKEALGVFNFFESKVLAADRPQGKEGGLGKDAICTKPLTRPSRTSPPSLRTSPWSRHRSGTCWANPTNISVTSEAAIREHSRAFELRRSNLGPDDPDTLRSQSEFARAIYYAGKIDEAEPLVKEALLALESKLGPDDPDTLRCQNNLANICLDTGRIELATQLHEKTWKARKSRLGENDPATLISQGNLASAYLRAGKLNEGILLHQETLEADLKLLGPYHPDTLWNWSRLAGAYRTVGNFDKAITINTFAVEGYKATFGADHFKTINSENALAMLYEVAGMPSRSIALSRACSRTPRRRWEPIISTRSRPDSASAPRFAEPTTRPGRFPS